MQSGLSGRPVPAAEDTEGLVLPPRGDEQTHGVRGRPGAWAHGGGAPTQALAQAWL